MKVGTDGVLLGAWACVENAIRILDIGAGTGLLSLMTAQRSKAQIVGIEIDTAAARQAQGNASRSPWADRIQIENVSLQNFSVDGTERFNHIISNPPYFNHSLQSPDGGRTAARHTASLTYGDLLSGVARLLSPDGLFSVVLPYPEQASFIEMAEAHKLLPRRILRVYPTPTASPKRFLAEFSFQPFECVEADLVIEAGGRHQYSEEYKNLTKEYYLKF